MVLTAYTAPKRPGTFARAAPAIASASGNAAPRQAAVGRISATVSHAPRATQSSVPPGCAASWLATRKGTWRPASEYV
jgi:hypothetical protein